MKTCIADPVHDRTVTVHITRELSLVAHQIAGTWVVSWAWRGRLLLGVEPYVAGSDELS